jgi:hypothetical protein
MQQSGRCRQPAKWAGTFVHIDEERKPFREAHVTPSKPLPQQILVRNCQSAAQPAGTHTHATVYSCCGMGNVLMMTLLQLKVCRARRLGHMCKHQARVHTGQPAKQCTCIHPMQQTLLECTCLICGCSWYRHCKPSLSLLQGAQLSYTLCTLNNWQQTQRLCPSTCSAEHFCCTRIACLSSTLAFCDQRRYQPQDRMRNRCSDAPS